jgi:hypothetical protein
VKAVLNPDAGVDAVMVDGKLVTFGTPITVTRSEFDRVNAVREGRPLLLELAPPRDNPDGEDTDPADHHQEDA